ncbi:MAG TPA: phosphoenolpyruvate carboxykinase (ATP), partial [Devosiaceae bacterium]|nr:phosphoenolpyruvate carboxykinase (ATP) [Devosiaceae bacterium]
MTAPQNLDGISAAIRGNAKCLRSNDVTLTLSVHAARQHDVTYARGALAVSTGKSTGRSPDDKYILRDSLTDETVWWEACNAIDGERFELLLADMLEHFSGAVVFEQQLFAGADRSARFSVDMFTPSAWHALFIRHLLIRPVERDIRKFKTDVTIVHAPDFLARPEDHGTRTGTCIALDFSRNIILICGTAYAGEIKKAVFTLFNFHAPAEGILPMHCAANVGQQGDSALFFGLSGTGKTTLSTAPDRALVGDDEHGWSEHGIFNLEGGCYAKALGLTPESEPEIYAASRQFGAILENVTVNAMSGEPDFADPA